MITSMKHRNQPCSVDTAEPGKHGHTPRLTPTSASNMPVLYPRYARHLSLQNFGEAAQSRLAHSGALIVGLGGLGSAAAVYLAAAGIGRLVLADFDRVDETNLQRQILYRMKDVGQRKTRAASAALLALNPTLEVEELDGRLADSRLASAISQCDIVIDGSDNFATRAAVNQACLARRRPLVSGAALRWEGRLAVFDLREDDSPCLACLHPDMSESLETCERGGVLGPLVGVIGSLQAVEALKLLTGTGTPMSGRLLRYTARSGRFSEFSIGRRADCPACRDRPATG